ncbi:MAG: two-component system, cell cycle sensor histidine kinase and response regulator CckA [Acidobacteriota bacterium]|jgi:PAS domain S-box-containing protein|nr:two-component system, cell cycle sensor histidine kinase and response regulator CckA [Acidobacteriota bacterium]
MELAAYDEAEALTTLPGQKTSSEISSKLGQILVVDDEVELKNALVEMLIAQGYTALGCTSGTAALSALREQNFDVLLSDLMMPEMDGVALLRAALEIDQNLVCIIMTGQGTIQTAVDAMKVGAFDYVLKPFRLQALLPVLTRAINVRQLSQENLHLRETVAIYELCQTIAFTLDRQTLLSKLADAALQQSEADELSILLPTADGSELYVAAIRGENRTRLLDERVVLEQGISGWVARERTPLLLEGQVNDARFTAMWPRADIRSAISVPLQVAGKLVGIININNVSSPRPFTLGQMKALTILASTAAAALESTSLYERVRQAEQNYRSIFENAVEGIFQSTPEGRFVTVNPSLARILGYDSPEEVIETITDITHQLYVDPERRAETNRLQEEHGVLQGFEFEAYRKDGEKIWLSLNRRFVRDENGVGIYREGSVEDITERKRAEQALRASEAELRALFAAMTDVILVLDRDGRYQKIAPTDPAYLYKPSADLLGKRLHEVFPEEEVDFFLAHIRRALDEGRMHRVEYSLQISGTEVWFDGSVSPMSKDSVIWIARDITERKRAEEALHESEERYRVVAETATDVIVTIDENSTILFANGAVERVFGYAVSELLGCQITILMPEYLRHVHEAAVGRYVRTGRKHINWEAVELPGLHKSGREIPLELSFGEFTKDRKRFFTGIARDISERKQAEEQLRRQLDFTETITASLGEGVYALDAGGRLTFMNSAAESALGWTEDELLGQKIHEIIHFQHADGTNSPAEECPLLGVLNSGKTIQIEGDVFTRRDGSLFPVSYNSSPIISGVQVAGAVLAFHDITERKRAEEALLQSEQRYRLLFERNPQSMWVFDLETLAFLEVNDAAIHHYGYAREEFLAMTIKDIRPAEDVPNLLANVSGVTPQHDEAGVWKHRKRDGTVIDVEITAHELTYYGRPAQIVLAYDVTERGSLEEQLRQSQKLEAVGQLAGGVAHDFNNLLTVITGYSDLSLRRLDKNNPLRANLEEIKKAGERAASLTRQLLAFSRKQVLQPKVLQLNAIVADVDKMLRRLIGEDIDPLTVLEPSLGQIKADPGQIEQVLLNLAVNARDAMPQGGKLTIETQNVYLDNQDVRWHTAIQPGNYVMLAVSDTGCGIDAETQMRMFEPFFTTKEQGKGTGLGLSTVYGIVKQSGGHLWVYSEVGKGTTFKIYLPRVDEVTERDEPRTTQAELPQGRETVLLTEDEEQVRQMTRMILEMGGYRVLEAASGEEALAIYKQHEGQIDLVMTDVVMPKMSGRELAQSLEVFHPGIKVLYMSGYTDDAIVRHGLLDQEIAFLQKPFTPDALMRKVREVLDAPHAN